MATVSLHRGEKKQLTKLSHLKPLGARIAVTWAESDSDSSTGEPLGSRWLSQTEVALSQPALQIKGWGQQAVQPHLVAPAVLSGFLFKAVNTTLNTHLGHKVQVKSTERKKKTKGWPVNKNQSSTRGPVATTLTDLIFTPPIKNTVLSIFRFFDLLILEMLVRL